MEQSKRIDGLIVYGVAYLGFLYLPILLIPLFLVQRLDLCRVSSEGFHPPVVRSDESPRTRWCARW